MLVPEQVASKYALVEPHLRVLETLVREPLGRFCRAEGYHLIHRVKTLESTAEKIESGRYASWAALDDLVGFLVIVPTQMHEDKVLRACERWLDVRELRRRGAARKSPQDFRYDSTRLYGVLKGSPGAQRSDTVTDTLVEVQIQSAFEFAWWMATHDLVYKSDKIEWKRYRLAAQLRANAEQADMIIRGFEQSADLVVASEWDDVSMRRAVRELLLERVVAGAIPEELAPKDWSRCAENVYGLIKASARSRRNVAEQFARAIDVLGARFVFERRSELPRSCSLLQVVCGVLVEENVLTTVDERYCMLVTPQVLEFFPTLRGLAREFALA